MSDRFSRVRRVYTARLYLPDGLQPYIPSAVPAAAVSGQGTLVCHACLSLAGLCRAALVLRSQFRRPGAAYAARLPRMAVLPKFLFFEDYMTDLKGSEPRNTPDGATPDAETEKKKTTSRGTARSAGVKEKQEAQASLETPSGETAPAAKGTRRQSGRTAGSSAKTGGAKTAGKTAAKSAAGAASKAASGNRQDDAASGSAENAEEKSVKRSARSAAKKTSPASSGRKKTTAAPDAAQSETPVIEAVVPAASGSSLDSAPDGAPGNISDVAAAVAENVETPVAKRSGRSRSATGSRARSTAKSTAATRKSDVSEKGPEAGPEKEPAKDIPADAQGGEPELATVSFPVPAAAVSAEAPADPAVPEPRAFGEKSAGGRASRARGSSRGKKAEPGAQAASQTPLSAKAAPVVPEEAADSDASPAQPPMDASGEEPADFPTGFGDSGPEDFFAAHGTETSDSTDAEAADEPLVEGEKKRRSRSRRGRGRKKGAAQAAAEVEGVSDPDDAEPEENDEEDQAVAWQDVESREEDHSRGGGKASRRKMFVSVLPQEQIEVVITEEGQVQEYYVEMLHQAKTKGNIYKGIVHNVDPNLQAAFVSYGAVKNGFLQIDEVHPEYYVSPHEAGKGRKYPPIQKVLKAGQELLVQIVKEPAGTKGAFLTTYLSLPGRFLVLTPGREQIGVSRKVENEGERARLRELLEGLSPGPGLGVIVRTVSMGASKTSLQRDLQYLKRTWKDVRARGTTEKAPCLVYQEMDLTSRAVRDYLTETIGEVWIDDEETAAAVSEIAEALFPRKQSLVKVHKDASSTLFERFNLQRQLDQIHSREVVLPSGGRLVIDPTEALTAIDINSGRSGGKSNFEDMAFRTNMEAARMIPLQLRLRDIGGQVVADFIEMRDKSHWREVEKTLRNGMKVDRARYDVGKIGPFGMLEIVRQRLGSSAISISTEPCPCCGGTGVRRNMEWRSQHCLRDILRLLRNAQAQNESAITYEAEQPLAIHLLNHKRQRLLEMEQQYGVRVDILVRSQEPV